MADRKRLPSWARWLWGAALVLLNAFLVVYLLAFFSAFLSLSVGPVGPVFARRLFFDEQMFFAMFGVVGVSVLVSFTLLGLSMLHIFLWSGLQDDRKIVWAAVVFAGMQPGMLAYWLVNVRERPEPRGTASPEPTAPRGRHSPTWLVLLGVLSVVPVVYFAAFMLIVIGGIASASSGASLAPALLNWLPAAHLGVIFLWWGLMAVYLVDVYRTPRLVGMNKALWAVVIAFAGPVGWPIYWYLNMWREPSLTVPTASAPEC